jgi:hypothetical protein
MKSNLCLLISFFICITKTFSQQSSFIRGRVTDTSTNAPVAGCSVFINSTSKGTTTTTSGKFELSDISAGKFELIVSSVGYETYVYPFSGNQLPLELEIKLKQKATDLPGVTVEPFLKDGWQTWGQTFIENLIGTTDFASRCTIKNKEVIRFRFSRKKNELTAIADEPLIIENKALGYTIRYQLEEFRTNFNTQTNVYLGYPLFTDMPAKSNVWQIEWRDNREKVYQGSIMHFIRSLYNNEIQVTAEYNKPGFEIRKLVKLPNTEKQRIIEIQRKSEQNTTNPWPPDSLKYFKKVMRQNDSLVVNKFFTAEELITLGPDQSKSLFFTDQLSIIFRRKRKLDTEVQKSTIYLSTPAPVSIEENGYYTPPLEIFTLGYWAQSQKLANLLPLNYWPEDE